MYCGYECISNMAGEVKNPQVIPKGLMIAMPLVALTYVLPTLGGLASLPEGSWAVSYTHLALRVERCKDSYGRVVP